MVLRESRYSPDCRNCVNGEQRRFGVHTFIASNELNPDFFVDTAEMLFDLAVEIMSRLDIRLDFVNMSGGIGIPYKPDQEEVDLAYVGERDTREV